MSVTASKSKNKSGVQRHKKDIIGSTAGHLASKNKRSKVKTKKLIPHKAKSKQKTYTDKELGIPKLNTIVPAGIQKPKGKKKDKVYVDDMESMMTIYAMVNAEKEGQIESKMIKARQLEEIREARAKEVEARQQSKRDRINELKAEARGKKNGKFASKRTSSTLKEKDESSSTRKKKVSFADS